MVAIEGTGLSFAKTLQFTSLAYALFEEKFAPSEDASMRFAEAAMEHASVGDVGWQELHSNGQSFVALVLQANQAKKESKFSNTSSQWI
jgi:hypothetical protein